jgi:hypothetical protein
MTAPDFPRNEVLVPDELGAIGQVLAKGGQAEVMELSDFPSYVYKRYTIPGLTVGGARDLILVPGGLSTADARRLEEWACLPLNPVVQPDDRRRLVGLVLPRIPNSFYRSSGEVRDMEILLCSDDRMQNVPCDPPSWRERLQIALDCAEYVAFIHDLGLIIGDLNYRNELWRAGRTPGSYWIDTDSYRFADRTSSAASITSPGWSDPLSPRTSSVDTDRYKLGLLIYRMLVQHPTIVPKPDRIRTRLGSKIGAPLFDCLHDFVSTVRGERPKADRWAGALETELRAQVAGAPTRRTGWAKGHQPRLALTAVNPQVTKTGRPAIPLGPASTPAPAVPRPVLPVNRASVPPVSASARPKGRWRQRFRRLLGASAAMATALVAIHFIVGSW